MVNIHTILELLTGNELFLKFDIRWGYKNIHISEEDQHKAAFKTTFGTYIPQIMYFGLTNAPPHFQRVLQHDFADILQKYPKEVFNYMDNFMVVTQKLPEGLKRHWQICHELLNIMEKQSYYLKLSKCQFEQPKMDILGWLVEDGNIKIDPAKVTGIAEWPRELRNVKEVWGTLGVLGYQRPFTRGFADIAKPLTELTMKEKPFKWTQECTNALEKLINIVTSELVLACPDLNKPFELEVDASAYAVGTILFQRDENKWRRDVGYFLKALNPAEWNYDIWDREFLAVVTGLCFWRHLLIGSSHKVTVWTDDANLQYYQHPQKVNRRVARYIAVLEDYNLKLKHLPGTNNHANGLPRGPDYDQGGEDNDVVTALPNELFARVISNMAFDEQIHRQQKEHLEKIKEWKDKHSLKHLDRSWWKGTTLVVTGGEHMWRTIAEPHHDSPTARHQGTFKTIGMMKRDYWWSTMQEYLKKYIQGCGTCQQSKSNTHPNKPPLQPIALEINAEPFQTIAMDFIIKLPTSNG
jgi:RNase H-like domain found in reverse transcriptase/Integrase zinc binding domain/Reverse transcriptase (RNA-dependent DNA polymerase)